MTNRTERTLARAALLAAALAGLAGVSHAEAQSPRVAERTATATRQAETEAQARQITEDLFQRLCPGRCEVIQLRTVMGEPDPVALLEPGFEDDAPAAYEGRVESIGLDILLDSQLPQAFRQNLPRMLRYRLQGLAPVVEIRTESLAFPEPQLEPTPPVLREPIRRYAPPPPPPPMPETAPEPAAQPAPPAPAPAVHDTEDIVARAVPWIGGILIALILAILIMVVLRRLTQRRKDADGAEGTPSTARSDAASLERYRQEIREILAARRGTANAALESWLLEDPDEVARFVSVFGPASLEDLKSTDALRASFDRVSRYLVTHPDALSEVEELRLLRAARARFAAAELENTRSGAWDFLEGLTREQVARLLEGATVAERAAVLLELSESARAAFLTHLGEEQRGELLAHASLGSTLSPSETGRLQVRLRGIAEALRGQGANGASALVGELLSTVEASAQLRLAASLRRERPEVADAILDAVLLERAVPSLPPGLVSDVAAQVPIEHLVTFLRQTDEALRAWMVERVSPVTRRAVEAELALPAVVSRARFFEARRAVLEAVARAAKLDGVSLREANLASLEAARGAAVEAAE